MIKEIIKIDIKLLLCINSHIWLCYAFVLQFRLCKISEVLILFNEMSVMKIMAIRDDYFENVKKVYKIHFV